MSHNFFQQSGGCITYVLEAWYSWLLLLPHQSYVMEIQPIASFLVKQRVQWSSSNLLMVQKSNLMMVKKSNMMREPPSVLVIISCWRDGRRRPISTYIRDWWAQKRGISAAASLRQSHPHCFSPPRASSCQPRALICWPRAIFRQPRALCPRPLAFRLGRIEPSCSRAKQI